MRAFFALNPPPEILAHSERFLSQNKEMFGGGIRWVKTNQIHLTLKFYRAFAVDDIHPIQNRMRAELINLDFSELRIQGGGCFPNNRNPRIIWLGLNPTHGIKKVVEIIEAVSESYGYKKENRSFNPHLTIGRVKKHASAVEKELIAKSIPTLRQYESEPFQFSRIRLVQSTLTPAGPIYKDVFELRF